MENVIVDKLECVQELIVLIELFDSIFSFQSLMKLLSTQDPSLRTL